jgi:site-specific DNA recombinase
MTSRTHASRRAAPLHQRQAVLYARVSSKEQEREGFSIPSQQKLLHGYAREHGLVVAQEFVDVETAKQAGRTAFGEMVAHLRAHTDTCRVLLVEKTDRLYRNIKDWVTLDELDVEIHLVKEGTILSRDSRSSEKFMHGIKVLMAKNYIDNLGEESRKGMLEKAEEGIWPSQAPLGYRNVTGPNGKKLIEVDPAAAPLVTRMFETYAAGRHSLTDMVRLAREEGLRTKKGCALTKASIHYMFHTRLYMGEFVWQEKTYAGTHTPLVSREVWERVQAILDGRFETRHRKVVHDFAFSHLIRCGHCGCSLVGEIKKGRYVYYHCTGYKGKCPEPYTREEVLEERFGAVLESLTFDDDVMAWVAQALRESHRDQQQHHEAAIARLRDAHDRLQRRIDAAYLDKVDGRIDGGFFDRMAGQWRAEQDQIARDLQGHLGANRHYLDEGVKLLELARRAAETYRRQSPSEKRKLLDFVVSNSTWKGGELAVSLRQPFDMLAESAAAAQKQTAAGVTSDGRSGIWLRLLDSNQRPGG